MTSLHGKMYLYDCESCHSTKKTNLLLLSINFISTVKLFEGPYTRTFFSGGIHRFYDYWHFFHATSADFFAGPM